MTPRKATTTKIRRWAGLLVFIALLLAALLIPGSALAASNFKGTWTPDVGVPWTITSENAGGGCEGTSIPGFVLVNCQVSGDEYRFDVDEEGSSYESHNHGIIEGNKVTGEFDDPSPHAYTATRTGGATTVNGQVFNQKKEPVEGITVSLTGTSDESETVAKTAKTSIAGAYSFEVPAGTYSVTASGDPDKQYGGELAVTTGASGPECNGTAKEATCTLKHLAVGEEASAGFTYTQCGASARETNSHEPTGCPIIFIPGILGSRITCGTEEIYPNIPNPKFSEMELTTDGETNLSKGKACEAEAHTPPGEAGLFTSAPFVGDVYEGAFNYIKRIATNGAYVYPYDWRRGVPVAAKGLEALVNEVLKETSAKHVVLVAHSMGGLVTQNYIEEGGADKVSRALTIGTPYWGAPKSLIALMNGYSNEFALENADHAFGVDQRPEGRSQLHGAVLALPVHELRPVAAAVRGRFPEHAARGQRDRRLGQLPGRHLRAARSGGGGSRQTRWLQTGRRRLPDRCRHGRPDNHEDADRGQPA